MRCLVRQLTFHDYRLVIASVNRRKTLEFEQRLRFVTGWHDQAHSIASGKRAADCAQPTLHLARWQGLGRVDGKP